MPLSRVSKSHKNCRLFPNGSRRFWAKIIRFGGGDFSPPPLILHECISVFGSCFTPEKGYRKVYLQLQRSSHNIKIRELTVQHKTVLLI